jgi:hypothetical protein
MANENINARDLKDIASVNAQLSGNAKEFNDIVRESINALKMMAKSYDSINAKIDNMNKGVINTKKIQAELEKASAKASIAQDKYNQASDKATAGQKRRANLYEASLKAVEAQTKKLQQATITGNAAQIQQEQLKLNRKFAQLDNIKASLEAQDIELIALKESAKMAEKLTRETEDRLFAEKQLEKSLGRTGMFIGFMNKKFGLFKDTYSKIVEEARDGNNTELNKIKIYGVMGAALYGVYKLAAKIGSALLTGLKSLVPEGGGPISKLTAGITDMLNKIPLIGPVLGGLATAFTTILDIVIGINDTIVKAGRNLGMNTAQATALYKRYAAIAYQSNDIFVTSKKMLDSQVELGQALEVNNLLSAEALTTNIKLKDIAGLEAGVRADIAENAIIAGQSSEELVSTVAAQVKGLQKATGISFNYQKVLAEANKLGGYLGLAFAKYPDKLSKALVTTKALGTSLKEMDSIADSLLDFESSISKQFEAQLFTGKDINLQEARRMFLNNDLAGAALEINKQLGSSEEFLHMNRFAAMSLAESFGMSRDQLGEMLRRQELLSKLGAKDTDNARTQLKLGLEKYKNQKALSAAVGEEVYNNLVNASTQERIASFIDKIKTSIIDLIEGTNLIDKIQSFVSFLSKPENLKGLLNTIKSVISGAVSFFGDLMAGLSELISHLPGTDKEKWQGYADRIRMGSAAAAERINMLGEEQVSVGNRVAMNQASVAPAGSTSPAAQATTNAAPQAVTLVNYNVYDGEKSAPSVRKYFMGSSSDNVSGFFGMERNISSPGQY